MRKKATCIPVLVLAMSMLCSCTGDKKDTAASKNTTAVSSETTTTTTQPEATSEAVTTAEAPEDFAKTGTVLTSTGPLKAEIVLMEVAKSPYTGIENIYYTIRFTNIGTEAVGKLAYDDLSAAQHDEALKQPNCDPLWNPYSEDFSSLLSGSSLDPGASYDLVCGYVLSDTSDVKLVLDNELCSFEAVSSYNDFAVTSDIHDKPRNEFAYDGYELISENGKNYILIYANYTRKNDSSTLNAAYSLHLKQNGKRLSLSEDIIKSVSFNNVHQEAPMDSTMRYGCLFELLDTTSDVVFQYWSWRGDSNPTDGDIEISIK